MPVPSQPSRAPACAYSAYLAELAEAPMFAVVAPAHSHGMSLASMDTQVTQVFPCRMQAPKHGILCSDSTNRHGMAGTAS